MWTDINIQEDLSQSEKDKIKEILEKKLKWRKRSENTAAAGVKNLIAWRDQMLMIWSQEDVCIYCFAFKDETSISSMQTLALTKPPLFDVDSLEFSASARYLALAGSRGINIVELPQKWGAQNVYEAGKSPILCRSWSLDERFFVCNQKLLLLDARWHPASEDEKHIVLLTNDNCVRIYNIQEPHIVDQEIKLSGPKPECNESYYSAFASSLGEIAVSFDFGPPQPKNFKASQDVSMTTAKSDCLWPVYILKGNGDLLVVYTNLENPYLSQRVLGPLTMLPPAEDNYGVDACRLICLNCLPPLIVIATSSGILYHCIPLTNDEETHSGQSILPKPTIFVCECVELTLSLTSNDDEDILSPIRLFHDPFGPSRYFCGHAAGIHAISVPMVSCVQSEKLTFDDADKTVVQHLLCTKPIASMKDSGSLYGFAVSMRKGQQHIKVLLSSGDILNQRLSFWPSSLEILKDGKPETWLETKVEFSDHIKEILKRTSSAPLLRSNHADEKSLEKQLQLLLSTTEVYRQEYLTKMNLATAAFERRLKNLRQEKELQLSELSAFEDEKTKLLKSLTLLTEKYDSALERQSGLSLRSDMIVEFLQNKQANLSEAEIRMQKDLKNMCEKINVYREKIERLKLLSKYQQEMDQTVTSVNLSSIDNRLTEGSHPTQTQIKNVKNTLNKQGETISNLLHRVIRLKQNVSNAL